MAPEHHHFLLGTFRSPYLYTIRFTPSTRSLEIVEINQATGGHSWLDLSANKKYLYCTGWTDPPSLAAYQIVPPSAEKPYPTTELINTAKTKYLSGYVCSNGEAVFSASGPQGDVFAIDQKTGGFGQEKPHCTVSFLEGLGAESMEMAAESDFGGLRHGGHVRSGRNCIWTYHVIPPSAPEPHTTLKLASKTMSKRSNDGPRHVWPHPNGKVVYVVQEHSSFVDVFEHKGDDLFWKHGVRILPDGVDCSLFWADEVRLSPDNKTLFASTRGLESQTKGYIISVPLDLCTGHMNPASGHRYIPSHIHQTSTSGGFANAISPYPYLGSNGEVWMTLTDSEVGFVQVLAWKQEMGFEVMAECRVGSGKGEGKVGASVAVWYE